MGSEKIKFLNEYSRRENNINNITVNFPKLDELLNQYMFIEKILRNIGSEDLKNEYKKFKYIFFILLNTIKPYKEELNQKFDENDWESFALFLEKLTGKDENIYSDLKKLEELIKEFKNGKYTNLLKKELENLLLTLKGETAIVLVEINRMKEINNSEPDIKCFDYNQFIKNDKFYENVVFVGETINLKKFDTIFMGDDIYYINYNFYKTKFTKKTIIDDNDLRNSNIFKNVKFNIESFKRKKLGHEDLFNLEMTKSIVDKERIINKYKYNYKNDIEKTIKGTICGLKSGFHILLSKSTNVRVLKFDEEQKMKLDLIMNNEKVNKLVEGDWILIKSTTENIYLEKKSKELISPEKYNELKEYVQNYKSRLTQKLYDLKGLENLYKDMKQNGIEINNVNTLKTWIGEDTIHPRNLNEILKYLQYNEVEIVNITTSADSINSLHRKVGRELSKNLQMVISDLDKDEIFESMMLNGKFEFEINQIGKFTIEEIKYKIENQMEFLRKDMNKLIKD